MSKEHPLTFNVTRTTCNGDSSIVRVEILDYSKSGSSFSPLAAYKQNHPGGTFSLHNDPVADRLASVISGKIGVNAHCVVPEFTLLSKIPTSSLMTNYDLVPLSVESLDLLSNKVVGLTLDEKLL